MKRACVFAHYDKNNEIDEYVYFYLKELLTIAQKIVFVTVSDIQTKDINRLENLRIKVIKRENIGYDFYSYKIGLGYIDPTVYDELIICNDSVFGPLKKMKTIFKQMEKEKCDFWGITDSSLIAYHIQSYFLVYRKNILNSNIFSDFWENVEILNNKNEIIQQYEVGQSKYLIENGFASSVYINYKMSIYKKVIKSTTNLLKKPYKIIKLIKKPSFYYKNILERKCNPTIDAWDELLFQYDIPFIKKSLFSSKKEAEFNLLKLDCIRKSYDINLIRNYLIKYNN